MTSPITVVRGSLVLVNLDPVVGHEQAGTRPCVVVSQTALVADQRYPVLLIVPFTGTEGLPPMYPVVQAYSQGLTRPSAALVDQIRSIDKQRVVRAYSPLPSPEMRRIDEALRRVLGI